MSRPQRAVLEPPATALFDPGRNCWAVTEARDVRLLIDGSAYFEAFMRAALLARHTLFVLGWDFHSQTKLLCGDEKLPEAPDAPGEIGAFLDFLARRRRGLHIRVLIWDFPTIFGVEREFPFFSSFYWKPHRRLEILYDDTHGTLGCHHQKVVVVDDELAFCGGIDLTRGRWDTCEHRGADPRRISGATPYAPFHDVMLQVSGGAALKLGQLARERWLNAGGSLPRVRRHLPGMKRMSKLTHLVRRHKRVAAPPLPRATVAGVSNVRIAIARTLPPPPNPQPPGSPGGVREVEALFVDMIRAARHTIYIENQYFTSHAVGDALEARMRAPDPPEIVVIVRLLSHGWLEELTMERLRTRLIERLQKSGGERFRVYYPHVEQLPENKCIDVHSKLMIVDDEWLRVGSANLANRSMGLDTECDLVIEAQGREDVQRFVRHSRARLLGEHLDYEPDVVAAAIEAHGGLIPAIESLRGKARTLKELELPEFSDTAMGLAKLGDPEQPVDVKTLGDLLSQDDDEQDAHGSSAARGKHGKSWLLAAVIVLVAIGATLAWRFTPLANVVTPERVIAWADAVGERWWAPFIVLLVYTPGCLIFFPRPLITLFAVMAFGPWLGFAYSLGGLVIAALATYFAGKLMHPHEVQRRAGPRVTQIMQVLRKRGLLAVTALRLVPLAPFAVEGAVAGAINLKLWHYTVGSAIGMLPGTLAATVFSDELKGALGESGHINFGLLAVMAALLVGGAWLVRRWFVRETSSARR